jgi:hypothetical protein
MKPRGRICAFHAAAAGVLLVPLPASAGQAKDQLSVRVEVVAPVSVTTTADRASPGCESAGGCSAEPARVSAPTAPVSVVIEPRRQGDDGPQWMTVIY